MRYALIAIRRFGFASPEVIATGDPALMNVRFKELVANLVGDEVAEAHLLMSDQGVVKRKRFPAPAAPAPEPAPAEAEPETPSTSEPGAPTYPPVAEVGIASAAESVEDAGDDDDGPSLLGEPPAKPARGKRS